jgi:hypothetical protein
MVVWPGTASLVKLPGIRSHGTIAKMSLITIAGKLRRFRSEVK